MSGAEPATIDSDSDVECLTATPGNLQVTAACKDNDNGTDALDAKADDLETPATVAGILSIGTTYLVRRSPVTLDYLLANMVHFHAGVCFVGATGPSHLFTGIVELLTYSTQPETTISSERIASGMVGFAYFRSRHHRNTV